MRNKFLVILIATVFFFDKECTSQFQQSLWFGTVKIENEFLQGRFEILSDSVIRSIVYAPYGMSPTTFQEVRHQNSRLSFLWPIYQSTYQCLLVKQDSTGFKGNCTSQGKSPIQLIIRNFTQEDAFLQGDSLHAGAKDLQILDRALSLMNNGSNWNHVDRRVCDISSYPYKWSLFCALHQASIDIDSEYKHLRPAIQATRQAINEITSGKKYAHLLQDFNNEAKNFESVAKVLVRAKEIITEKIKLHQ